jgi:hypothetical protein
MYVQIIIVTIIAYFKKRFRRTFLAPNTSTSLQTTLAADAHLAEGIIIIIIIIIIFVIQLNLAYIIISYIFTTYDILINSYDSRMAFSLNFV